MRDWSNVPVLVTGGNGFIGRHLVRSLSAQGAQVRVPFRHQGSGSGERLPGVEYVPGDLYDPAFCEQVVQGVAHVFHLASHRKNLQFHLEHASIVAHHNIQLSTGLIEAVRRQPVPVTFFSTALAQHHVATDAVLREGCDGYTFAKEVSESLWALAAYECGFPLLVIRPVGVYGPGSAFGPGANVIPVLLQLAQAGEPLVVWGDGRHQRAFVYVQDLLRAVEILVAADVQGVQYVSPNQSISLFDLAQTVARVVHPGLSVTCDPSRPAGDSLETVLPLHPLLESIEWTPLTVGLRRTFEWWQSARM